MGQTRKYAFDTEFAADGAILRSSPTRLSPEAVDAERRAAYERGTQDALAQAERDSAAALATLAEAAGVVVSRLDAESRTLGESAARLALAAARKIAGAALEAFGAERAAAAVEAVMETLRHQPRLVVKLSPEVAEALRPRIEAMVEAHAYAGAVLVRAEPGLGAGAVAIDWSDGVVALDPTEITQRVEAAVEAALASHATQSI